MLDQMVVFVAGCSGSGKSTLARTVADAVVPLDSFYRSIDDVRLDQPSGRINWDSVETYDAEGAASAIIRLVRTGEVQVPIYDYKTDRIIGTSCLYAARGDTIVAEGVFAFEVEELVAAEGVATRRILLKAPCFVEAVRRVRRDWREARLNLPMAVWNSLRQMMQRHSYNARESSSHDVLAGSLRNNAARLRRTCYVSNSCFNDGD